MGSRQSTIGAMALAIAFGIGSSGAIAQQQAIEEIVVTAKHREQNLQDVSLAITAFTSADIEAKGLADVRDVAQFTPSFSYYSGTGRADPTALIVRGLAPNTSDERYQGLSVFIDGIFLSGQLTSIDTSSLERVEVIKGPQAATFGRATYSGAVDYVTKTPSDNEFSGRVFGQWSSNSGNSNHNASVRVNIPVVADKMWLAVNATSLRRGELGTNPADGEKVGIEETTAFGITVYAEPNENLSIKFRYGVDRDRDSLPAFYVEEPAEWTALGSQTQVVPGGFVWPDGKVPDARLGIAGGAEFLDADRPLDGGRDRDRDVASLIIEADVLDGHELSYRGGYFDSKYWANQDFYFRSGVNDPFFGDATNRKARTLAGTGSFLDGLFADLFTIAFQEEFENTSHQVRLVSPGDRKLRYRGGFYYFKETVRNFRFEEDKSASNPTGQQRGDEWVENFAGFGGLEYDVSEQLTLSAEARVAREEVVWEECGFCVVNNTGNGRVHKDTQISPRFTVEYRPNDEYLLYGLLARGYKAARHNNNTRFSLPTAEPERLDNLEVGAKTTLADGRAILNLAGYYSDVQNQQAFYPVPDPATGGTTNLTGVGNFGDSRIFGFEIEGSVVVSEGWQVSGGVGYADHKFTSDGPPLNDFGLFRPGQTVNGLTTVNTPKWTGNLSTDYTFPIQGGAYDVSLRADMLFTGKMFVDRANLAYIDSVVRFNAKATLSAETWHVSVFAKDISDERTRTGAGLSGSSGCLYTEIPGSRCLSVGVPRGREVGVEAVLNF